MNVPQTLTLALERLARAEEERHLAVANRNAVIAALVAGDYPQIDIARHLGVSKARITHMLTAHKDASRAVFTAAEPGRSRRSP